jgi:CubicO group peptidase (beta-lactamase class C family)
MERLGTLPFVSQPGEAYVYGYNTDILGCIAEKASGVPLDELIRTRITGPLGMKDTMFYLPPAERDRLVTVYASNADSGGKIFRAPDSPLGQGPYVDGPRRSFSGGAGLLSTAHDYARFLEMIRQGGAIDGVRVLSPRTVELMTTNQSGTLHSDTGLGFGFGFETTDRYGANGLDGVGAFGWGGAYGSNYRVDPKSHLVLVMMINQMPNASTVGKPLPTVYQALVARRGFAGACTKTAGSRIHHEAMEPTEFNEDVCSVYVLVRCFVWIRIPSVYRRAVRAGRIS